jgi:hypothetical protein
MKRLCLANLLCLDVIVLLLAGIAAARAGSITIEAESGALGLDFAVSNSTSPAYITITSNGAGNNPGSAARVAGYTVVFPSAGTYQLYARVLVGAGAYNDDSLFYGNGFGAKSATNNSDWILVNGLAGVGFTADTDVVTGAGSAGTLVWKWINLSQFTGSAGFTVSAGSLTQTFQIGGREDGLDIDKLLFGTSTNTFTVAELDAGGPGTPPSLIVLQYPPDIVAGDLLQFNDNGNWTWYCDERSVVDKTHGCLVVGSDASGAGVGGSARAGDVEVVICELSTGGCQRYTLKDGASDPGAFYADDHNCPGLLVRPDGKYLAWYCGHNTERSNYWRNFDGTNWSTEQPFDWNTLPSGTDFNATYSNPHYLSAEGRTYNLVRANDHGSPNILVSSDYGDTWSFGGQLMATLTNVGYVSGYFKYCDNGVDRIDFIGTESHPRDTSTSMYHGYIKNGQSFKSDGTLVDADIFDQAAPTILQFTQIFTNGTVWPPGQTNFRCWNDDLQVYPDGTVQAIIATRINNDVGSQDTSISPNHAFFFCRYDGTNWNDTYLCQAGTKLYASEADYVGLGSLSPNDPNTLFISTKYDPRAVQPGVTDANPPYANFHEIWKGVTTNHGASFTWTPITQNSTHDNLRPIVPAWDANDIALLWFRATYNSAQSIDGAPVGLVERHGETRSTMTYADANAANTTLATGAALVTGAGTGQWHLETTGGNGGNVLASADAVAEDAPALKTTVKVPGAGMYDLWVNFWGNPGGGDWRVMAGTAANQMRLFRQMACKTVQPGDHDSGLVLTNHGTNFLYQAYVGRVAASASNTVSVYVDDDAVATGTVGTLAGDTARTWYDGISYARVETAAELRVQTVARLTPTRFTLTWNSLPPQALLLPQTFTVQKKNALSEPNWTTVAAGLPSGGGTTSFTDNSATTSAAFYRVTSP